MSPESKLPRETAPLIKAELHPGERIIWTGEPIPGRFARKSSGMVLLGIPWTAVAIFWMTGAGIATWGEGTNGDGLGFFQRFAIFPLFGFAVLLMGIGMLSSSYWMRRMARRTAYVITDQRALVFDPGIWRSTTIRTFTPDRLHDLRRIQRKDGSGDLVFERRYQSDPEGNTQYIELGFFAIANVKSVEDSIRTIMVTKNAKNDYRNSNSIQWRKLASSCGARLN